MRSLMIALLLASVVVLVGCTQNPVTNNTNANNTNITISNNTLNNTLNNSGAARNITIGASAISSDIDNALNETANINVNNTGDAVTPITQDDLNTE